MISNLIIRHNLPENATRENDQRLRNHMTIREGKRYSYELADDTIRGLYESGLIDDVHLRFEEDGQSIQVTVEVVGRPRWGPPLFIGNTVFSDQKLARVLKPAFKGQLTERTIEIGREKLVRFHRQHGYNQALITIDYEHWGKRSVQDFVFVIEEGPRTPPWYEGLFRPSEKATAP
jgi:outer membrane protein insertion porin family